MLTFEVFNHKVKFGLCSWSRILSRAAWTSLSQKDRAGSFVILRRWCDVLERVHESCHVARAGHVVALHSAMAVPAGTGHSLRDLPGSCQLLDTLSRVFQLGDATLAYTSRTPWLARDCPGGSCPPFRGSCQFAPLLCEFCWGSDLTLNASPAWASVSQLLC